MSLVRSVIAPAMAQSVPAMYFGCRAVWHRATPYGRLTKRLGESLGWRVAGGPFTGMRYVNRDPAHRPTTKLLGSYESELHDALAEAIAAGPRRIVNIGCAEGYYAAGMALALPGTEVLAYDLSPHAREECAETVAENGVGSRVSVLEHCRHADLANTPEGTLVLCDIEGGECELLDPAAAPGLRTATLIVELHDFLTPGVTEQVLARFAGTHRPAVIETAPRNPARYAALEGWRRDDARLALYEDRTWNGVPVTQRWAVLTPAA
jgi:hypothetical protein